jgi:hypothetical protein
MTLDAGAPVTGHEVPVALRRWFVVHFVADFLFAIPLFFAPEAFLGLLGWSTVDPFAARGVAAALFGIGAQSFLDRNASVASFRTMLSLKVIWATFAAAGFLWGSLTRGFPMAWAVFALFAAFDGLWIYWLRRLGRPLAPSAGAG